MIMTSPDENIVNEILKQLKTDQWSDLVSSLEKVRECLQTTLPPDKEFRKLISRLHQLSGHPKWEVRRAVIFALAGVRDDEVKQILETLSEDSFPYVQQAARQVFKNLSRGVTRISDKHYPTAEYLFSLVKKINPRNLRESYNAAVQVGQIHYRELARITAHEFRTSLILFETLVSEMEEFTNSGDGAKIINKLQTELDHMARKMDRLLVFAEGPDSYEVFKIGVLLQEVIKESRARKNCDFHGDIEAEGLEFDTQVAGDRQRLNIALYNLISNALEASPPEKNINVSIKDDNEMVKIEISDKGKGMDEQQMVNSFKPFQTTRREDGGMGLGIPIAQRVIQDFGGELILESEKGVGTKAIVMLPIHREGEK